MTHQNSRRNKKMRCRTRTCPTSPACTRLAHLLAAGPLLDRTSQFRGLSILNVDVEEARALKESDPAVQAGKFAVINCRGWSQPER